MISPSPMSCKQLSEFEKGQIPLYNDCELTFSDIAKKLHCHHLSIDVFLKNCKKTGNYPQKKFLAAREKLLHLKVQKLFQQQIQIRK